MKKEVSTVSADESGEKRNPWRDWNIGSWGREKFPARGGIAISGGRKGSGSLRVWIAGVILCLLWASIGCAPSLYSIQMRYQPTKTIPAALTDGRKYSLTVSSFVDRRKETDEILPWDFIDHGVEKTFLIREYREALSGETGEQG